jgi:hypothetical protein
MIKRECDDPGTLKQLVSDFVVKERGDFDHYISGLISSKFVQVDAAGLTPDEIADSVTLRIKPN